MSEFTHLNEQGEAHMVDVGDKDITERSARATAFVKMQLTTLKMILDGSHKKGDVLATCRIAGIMAAKKCPDLIPLCHTLLLTSVKVELHPETDNSGVRITSFCKLSGKTGVEMEALTAVSVAALTLYDMCKAVDKGMVISDVKLVEKSGGRSGNWQAEG